jgi:2-amino-4-hydroxy-6-hydroxymethyldihydropteridine diphosphokinase
MNDAYLSIGSNIGNRLDNIKKSVILLKENNINILQQSSIYITEPKGYKKQNYFYNAVLLISTKLSVDDFFTLTKKIELILGKKNNKLPNRPRIIDIDLLTFGSDIINSSKLTIPHPRLNKRKFVLVPWQEINSSFMVPVFNKTVFNLLNGVEDSSKICKLQL